MNALESEMRPSAFAAAAPTRRMSRNCWQFVRADARIRTADPFITSHRSVRDWRARTSTRGRDRPAREA
jgi:hypothetical protein